jgi:sugar lactone lactonase YvrE
MRRGGIRGLAADKDGVLYVSYRKTILRITTDGRITTFADPMEVTDSDKDLPEGTPESQLPLLKGLAVDGQGRVYAAATGCRCVVKIKADGKVETLLKAERPWSPTGIALQSGATYVLEYPNANGERHEDWVPRVRKIGRDGKTTTLVTFPKND